MIWRLSSIPVVALKKLPAGTYTCTLYYLRYFYDIFLQWYCCSRRSRYSFDTIHIILYLVYLYICAYYFANFCTIFFFLSHSDKYRRSSLQVRRGILIPACCHRVITTAVVNTWYHKSVKYKKPPGLPRCQFVNLGKRDFLLSDLCPSIIRQHPEPSFLVWHVS